MKSAELFSILELTRVTSGSNRFFLVIFAIKTVKHSIATLFLWELCISSVNFQFRSYGRPAEKQRKSRSRIRHSFRGLKFKETRKCFSLLQCLWNDGRLQRRIFNGVGKLYVSLQLYCWAILWGYLWRHISYHGNAQGPQKRPLNFSFCKLSEKLIRWPTIFISLLESSLNSLTFHTVWKKFIQ